MSTYIEFEVYDKEWPKRVLENLIDIVEEHNINNKYTNLLEEAVKLLDLVN